MDNIQLSTPIVFIIFNRHESAKAVFKEVRKARPTQLFIVADGPRVEREGEYEKVLLTRQVTENIDWECEVHRNYSDVNLGCGKRPATGITWALEHVKEAIIMEDDCLPDPSFFRFCEELLQRYSDDKRIMMISGTNSLEEWDNGGYSYHYSITYEGMTGWATWKRAWNYNDYEMKLWSKKEIQSRIKDRISDERQYKIINKIFNRAAKAGYDAWDYQWFYSMYLQSGLCIVPKKNLIWNLGYNEEATHTIDTSVPMARVPLHEIEFPLIHPPFVAGDRDFDKKRFRNYYPFIYENILDALKKGSFTKSTMAYITKIFEKRITDK